MGTRGLQMQGRLVWIIAHGVTAASGRQASAANEKLIALNLMFAPDPHAVNRELDRLVASNALKGSKRSQEFLRHVVEAALRGETDRLKERTLGVALFQRPADYDTSEDAIVRVKANEVRRRLAQAYQELGPAPEVEIALPAGSYVPEFRAMHEAEAAKAGEADGRSSGRMKKAWMAVAALAALAAGASAVVVYSTAQARLFWKPFLAGAPATLICAGETGEAGIEGVVGAGDMRASARLAAFLAKEGAPYRLAVGLDSTEAARGLPPAILVGTAAQAWVERTEMPLRFVPRRENGATLIEETVGRKRRWGKPIGSEPVEYAVVARVRDPRTGRWVMLAAGTGATGTRAAVRFLTRQEALSEALKQLKSGWASRSLQFVLKAKVESGRPPAPEVVEAEWW